MGLDGWFDGTVEQDGTLAYCSSAGGQPTYYAWWEMYPTNSIQWWFPISAGDKIKASVKFSRGDYVLAVKDVTARKHQTMKQVCASNLVCERTSADWIVERPGYGGMSFAPLANWGTMSLEADKASGAGGRGTVSSFPHFGITMMNNGLEHPLATPAPRRGARLNRVRRRRRPSGSKLAMPLQFDFHNGMHELGDIASQHRDLSHQGR